MIAPVAAAFIAVLGTSGPAPTPQGPRLAQMPPTNPMVPANPMQPPARPGRSYVSPEETNPGIANQPLLKIPGYNPGGSIGSPRPDRPGSAGPTADDCAAGYSKDSDLTRREFNRRCGQRR